MFLSTENINKLIAERKTTYSIEDNAVADFNRENELSKEYNGRQILELIQNADDANASKIEISINTSSKELSIYNDGEPFNFEGIKSIMIANISSKVTTNYIGNKGLGFRSLLFWAEKIRIISGGYIFTFSPEIAKTVSKELNLNIEYIRNERYLSEKCCPFPVLGIPEYEEDKEKHNGCTIILKFKNEDEDNIKSQLGLIDGKTMLFLKHVRTIVINYENEEFPPKELVVKEENGFFNADGIDWSIKTSSDVLPKEFQDPNKSEEKRLEIKIAIPSNHSVETYKLYNYLPTEETIGLPFIIHATLDLDSSRKHINNNIVNAFILKKTAEFISSYVDEILKNSNTCDWNAYEMMTPQGHSTSAIIKEHFEQILIKERDNKKIFPTIGNTYVNKDDYFFKDFDDSVFWNDFNVGNKGIINSILLPIPKNRHFNITTRPLIQYEYDNYINSLNNIFLDASLDIDRRVQLIIYLVKSISLENKKLMIFIDEKGDVIKSDDDADVFTPKTEGVEYNVPSFIKIHFIKKELYDKLFNFLKDTPEFKKIKENNDKLSNSRILCNVLRNITRIFDYDKDQVLSVIVSRTNRHLESLSDIEKVDAIKKMVKCLFYIYNANGFDKILSSVKLLNQNNEIVEASMLLLNTVDNHYVFGDDVDYLLNHDQWGIEDCKKEDFLDFAKRLGVNLMTKESVIQNNDLEDYAKYIDSIEKFVDTNIYNYNNLIKGMQNEKFIQMSNLMNGFVEQISFSKLLYLLASDDNLYKKIVQSQQQQLKYQYKRIFPINTEYSYLRYQFLTLHDDLKVLSNEVVLEDIDESSFPKSIQQERKNTILKFLTTNLGGVKNDKIAELINRLAAQSYPSKNIRNVYKILIESLSKDNRSLKGKNINLCAYKSDNGNEVDYYPVNEIYYSDNTSLPKAIVKSLGRKRLYYASRQGAKKICDVFGIKPIEDIYPKIIRESIKENEISGAFTKLFDKMKPYFLLYSIQNLDSNEAKRDLANRLKKSKIILVNSVEFKMVNQDDKHYLECAEFIQDNDTFYLNCADISSVKELQESVKYCNSVAEILSIISKLSGKSSIYIRIFQNLEFMIQTANYEFTNDELIEKDSLMGISQAEMTFWNNILPTTSSIDFSNDSFYNAVLKIMNRESFDFEKVDFLTWSTKKSKELLIILESKIKNVLSFVDLSVLQKNEFEEIKRNYRNRFIYSLWKYLSERKEKQNQFINYQQEYEHMTFIGDCHKLFNNEEYYNILNEQILDKLNNFSWDEKNKIPLCLYPEYESFLPELSIEEQSIFFFEGNDIEIKEIVEKYNQNINEKLEPNSESTDDVQDDLKIKILDIRSIIGVNRPTDNKQKKKGNRRTHTEMSNRQKQRAGKNAELLVKKRLENGGYEYQWVSGFSDEPNKDDTLGYDFRYKENKESEWRLLEVKNFNNDSFIMSNNEYVQSQKSKGKYDIALVKDGKVYVIQNFFECKNIQIAPDSYTIYCKLQV